MEDDLQILDCGDYYTVINKNYYAKRKHHSHFPNYKGAKIFIKLVERREVPRSPYLKESALRVSLNNKYKQKIRGDTNEN